MKPNIPQRCAVCFQGSVSKLRLGRLSIPADVPASLQTRCQVPQDQDRQAGHVQRPQQEAGVVR